MGEVFGEIGDRRQKVGVLGAERNLQFRSFDWVGL